METKIPSYAPENIRNIAIVGHSHAGKTALADAILFDEGATTRLGSTQDSTSTFDYQPEEIHRGGSIASHFGWVEHKGKKINLIDTPGDPNFVLDGLTALLGADAIVSVISAPDGALMHTRRTWAAARERNRSRVIWLNKMDKAEQDWKNIVKEIGEALHVQPVPIQVPIGSGENFQGVIDLFSRKALTWVQDGTGKINTKEIPEDLMDEVEQATLQLTEAVVSTDDDLLERYLDTKDIGGDELRVAFLKAVCQNQLVPLLFGCATWNMGVQPLLDLFAEALPSPLERGPFQCKDGNGTEIECGHNPNEPFLAQVIHTNYDEHVGQISTIRIFSGSLPIDGQVMNASTGEEVRFGNAFVLQGQERTKVNQVVCGDIISAVKLKNTHTNNSLCALGKARMMPAMTYPKPMISYLLLPKSKKDESKLKQAVAQMIEEDPTLSTSVDEISHHMVLHGMGHGHLENVVERMNRKFHLQVATDLPPIPYRETFATAVTSIEGKHKKQSGGAGQYGVCYINVEPLPRGKGFEFVNKIYGGAIPKQFIPSVEKGVVERAKRGMCAGFPTVDFRVTLTDGKYHSVDSKDIAFQMAGSKALKISMEKAGMKLLEPYYMMEIVVPQETSGDIMNDLTSRRGQIHGMDSQGTLSIIRGRCPLAEIQTYIADLRAMTAGKGSYMMEFDGYQEVPNHLVAKIKKSIEEKKYQSSELED